MLDPNFGIRVLPDLILIRRACKSVGAGQGQLLPLMGIADRKRKTLAIWASCEKNGILAISNGRKTSAARTFPSSIFELEHPNQLTSRP